MKKAPKKLLRTSVDSRFDTSKDPRFKKYREPKFVYHADSRFAEVEQARVSNKTQDDLSGDDSDSESPPDQRLTGKKVFRWDASSSSSEDDEAESEGTQTAPEAEDRIDSIPQGEATHRLALLGCDWENVTADDLFSLIYTSMTSVKPGFEPSAIRRVAVYASDFGCEQMRKHQQEGTPTILAAYTAYLKQKGESLSHDNEEIPKDFIIQYQKEQARYYYAVLEFDTAENATLVYNELDNVDHQFFLEGFDLRFIPDDLPPFTESFPRPYRDVAEKLPDITLGKKLWFQDKETGNQYRHSKVRLDLDEIPARRKTFLKKAFTEEGLADQDLKDYLASASDTDSENNDMTIDDIYLPPSLVPSSEAPVSGPEDWKPLSLSAREIALLHTPDPVRVSNLSPTDLLPQKSVALLSHRTRQNEALEMPTSHGVRPKPASSRPSADRPETPEKAESKSAQGEARNPWEVFLQKRRASRKERRQQLKRVLVNQKLELQEKMSKAKKRKSSSVAVKLQAQDALALSEPMQPTLKKSKRLTRLDKLKLKRGSLPASDFGKLEQDERFAGLFTDKEQSMDVTNPKFKMSSYTEMLLRKNLSKNKTTSIQPSRVLESN